MPRHTQVVFLHPQELLISVWAMRVSVTQTLVFFPINTNIVLVGNRVLKIERPNNACYVPELRTICSRKML